MTQFTKQNFVIMERINITDSYVCCLQAHAFEGNIKTSINHSSKSFKNCELR